MTITHVLVDARNRAGRFHIVQLAVAAILVAIALLAADQVFGMNPNNPDPGLSWLERAALSLVLVIVAVVLVVGVTILGLRYVVELTHRDGMVDIVTQAPFWRHRFRLPLSDLSLGVAYAPVVTGRQYVDAPWHTLRVAGRRIPYYIDLQARRCEIATLRGLLGGPRDSA